MSVHVLRLGHRIFRDQRTTSHCCLVSRVFGADKIYYSGQKDRKLEESVNQVTRDFGGPFGIEHIDNWKKHINNFSRGKIINLTVYGLPLQKKIKEIRKEKNLLIIIGGEKTPPEVYQLSDWNISITSQPHSEIAALSVFLHEYFKGEELNKKFKNPRKRIVPQERGKKIIELK